jgi:hypothetical protein
LKMSTRTLECRESCVQDLVGRLQKFVIRLGAGLVRERGLSASALDAELAGPTGLRRVTPTGTPAATRDENVRRYVDRNLAHGPAVPRQKASI